VNITIKTIPQKDQRYETIGDYWFDAACQGPPKDHCDLEIRVSDTGNWKYEALLAIHELVEVLLCKDRRIAEPDIMAFDKAFEARRTGLHGGPEWSEGPAIDDEPGDDPAAPYGKEHRFAENIERLVAAELSVNWAQYDNDLFKIWHPK
jgi:hypothetical protein